MVHVPRRPTRQDKTAFFKAGRAAGFATSLGVIGFARRGRREVGKFIQNRLDLENNPKDALVENFTSEFERRVARSRRTNVRATLAFQRAKTLAQRSKRARELLVNTRYSARLNKIAGIGRRTGQTRRGIEEGDKKIDVIAAETYNRFIKPAVDVGNGILDAIPDEPTSNTDQPAKGQKGARAPLSQTTMLFIGGLVIVGALIATQ